MSYQTEDHFSGLDRSKYALDVVDHIYAVAIDPDRLEELVKLWTAKLGNDDELANDLTEQLSDHFARATTIVIRGDQEVQHASPKKTGDRSPVIGINLEGSILNINSVGARTFGLKEFDRITDLPFTEESIEILMDGVQRAFSDRVEQIARLIQLDNKRFEIVLIDPSGQTQKKEDIVELRFCHITWSAALATLLSRTFDLTPAEIEVTRHVYDGAAIPQIASARNSTVSTVRTQLRTIYDKTNTRGQVELLRMMIGLAASRTLQQPDEISAADARLKSSDAAVKTPYPKAEHEHRLELRDGRFLSYSDFGSANGKPVLHLHDYFSGDAWPAAMAEEAIRRDLRIITPARALYGKTDAYPRSSHPFVQFAEDVAHLVDHLELDGITLLLRAMGAKYAPAIIHKIPGRVTGMVGVAPELHLVKTGEPKSASQLQHFFNQACSYTNPGLYEFMVRTLYAIYRFLGPEAFLKRVVKGVRDDMAVLRDPAVFEALERGLEFTAANGHEAAHLDGKTKYTDGPDWWVETKIPYHVIVGANDTVPRAMQTQALIEKGAAINLTVVPDGGFLVFFSHQDMVLDILSQTALQNCGE